MASKLPSGPPLAARAMDFVDVLEGDGDARVLHGAVGEVRQRAAAPLLHHRVQLGHHHARAFRQHVERGAQGVAHAQSADEDARRGVRGEAPAGHRAQRHLRAVRGAGHQHAAVDGDEEVVHVALLQGQHAVGRLHGLEGAQRLHAPSLYSGGA